MHQQIGVMKPTSKEEDSLKDVTKTRVNEANIKEVKDASEEVMKACMCVKTSGNDHEEHHREIAKHHVGRIRKNPQDFNEANSHLEHCTQMCFARKKPE